MKRSSFNGELIEAFAGTFLSPRYDNPAPTPPFHRVGWDAYASLTSSIVLVAPRDHAKSTAFTFDFILAEVLFRISDYVILIGATEPLAQEQLSNIIEELKENEPLRRHFKILDFETDQKTDLICRLSDGYRFRILARGAEQRIRGRMWKGKRPNLIVCDDMEDDEQVESIDRRGKFRRWFFRAAKQALSKNGRIRVHGTILHEDSLLSRLLKNPSWNHLFFKAHRAFDDFSEILWPEGRSEEWLRSKQAELVSDGDAAGYSQEFLNDPFDHSEAYLRPDDFIPMSGDDHLSDKVICAAWDFSTGSGTDRTSCTVGGKDSHNLVHVVDQRVGRWHSLQIVEEIFSVQKAWNPDFQFVEDDNIWKTMSPMIYREMQIRDTWISFVPIKATKDKATRARSYQKRHRARGMRFDTLATWYPAYQQENIRFTGTSQAVQDDQFDSTALLCKGFDEIKEVDDDDFLSKEEIEMEQQDPRKQLGRNRVTGY